MPTFTLLRRHAPVAMLTAVCALFGNPVYSQTFPDKPLRIVVGAPAGGTSDVIARVLAEGMSQLLKQPVMVDNKPGAAGVIGLQELLKAPRDGHTLMVVPNGVVSEIPHVIKLPVEPIKEIRPVAELARSGLLMVGAPNVPASNLKEVVAHVKANPGKISFASYSTGTLSHTLGLEFNKLAGLDMTHVGYKGSPPALTDVMGGHVPYMFDGPATSIPMIKTGKIKVFATTAPSRMAILPDVPTFAELGYKDMTEVLWIGLWLMRDVPAPAQSILREAVVKTLAQQTVKDKFAALGMEPGSGASPEELGVGLQKAFDKQAATLKAIGFKPE